MDPQIKAIETIDRNLAVNAGAGTGKTKVLTERYLHILEDGDLKENQEVESIVAITFTKKATEEMIERIRKLIRNNFSKGDKWKRYYRDMEKANISTIHSFCGNILRENPVEAGIDPMFEVVEEYTSKELLLKSIDKVLGDYIEKKPVFYEAISQFKINRLEDIYDNYVAIYKSIGTIGLSIEEAKEISMKNLESLKLDKKDLEKLKSKVSYLMSVSRGNSKIAKFQETEEWISFTSDNYSDDEMFSLVESLKDNIGSNKNQVEAIEEINGLINKILITKEINYKDYYEVILDSLIEIDREYSKRKREISGLDYDDLQLKALKLLDNDHILKRYQDKYKYIMVDEFQDTNELQKKIFYKLSSKEKPLDRNNLFVVGDPKQSIYAFRGADIDVFYQVLEDVANISKDNIVTLDMNYRSVNTVLSFINGIFEKVMGDRYDRLNPAKESKNKIDVEVLDNEEIEKSEDANLYEADLIAKRIKQMVTREAYDYKDFALLFRATTRNFYYEEALKKYGIPFHNSSSKRYFYRQEVLDIMNGLKAISNPFDKISMIGFLRGPMAGLSDDTIFKLLSNEDENLYISMEKLLDINLGNNENLKLKNTYDLLTYFYSIKYITTTSQVLEELLDRTNFKAIQLLKDHGKQSLANINKFINIVEEFDNKEKRSLELFIDYIEKIRIEDTGEGVLSTDNAVNILTIHKSKGLQFPVVIIPELAKDNSNKFPNFLFHKELGLGIKFEEAQAIHKEISSLENEKLNKEKERVMYVAMTRAERKLILGNIGKSSGYKKMLEKYLDTEEYRLIDSIEMDISEEDKKAIFLDTSRNESIELDKYPNLMNVTEKLASHTNRFSISQFLMYKECKRKFYLNHVNKLDFDSPIGEEGPDQIISAIDKGNIIHEFCQLYDGNKDDRLLIEEISQRHGIELKDSIYKELRPYMDNFKRYSENKYEKVLVETPFSIRMDDFYVSGIIDRINFTEDGLEVVDIKTNRLFNKDSLIEHYSPQLRFYAHVVEKVLGERINKATILFLENGEEVHIDISKDKLDTTMGQLVDFFKFVEKNRDLQAYQMSNNCTMCNYNNFCNYIELK